MASVSWARSRAPGRDDRLTKLGTVKVAEIVVYCPWFRSPRQMGLTANIRPTPPLHGAHRIDVRWKSQRAYTAFATMVTLRGSHTYINQYSARAGTRSKSSGPTTKARSRSTSTYRVDRILKDVLNKRHRRAGSRQRVHFAAAGRPPLRRCWFAGFTSNLVCVILMASTTIRISPLRRRDAAPIWADFMIHATAPTGLRDFRELDKPKARCRNRDTDNF